MRAAPGYHFRRLRNSLIRRIAQSRLFTKANEGLSLPPNTREIGVTHTDHIIYFNPNDDIGKHLLRHGDFYRGAVENVVKLLDIHSAKSRNQICVEVGANIGTQTVYLSLTDFFSRIVALEPVHRNFELLGKNVSENNLDTRVQIVKKAIWRESGRARIFLDQENSGAHSFIGSPRQNASLEVETITVGDLFEQHDIDADSLGFVWIDAEGAEPEIIRQLTKVGVSANSHPVFIEFSPVKYTHEETRDLIENFFSRSGRMFLFKRNEYREASVADLYRIKSQADVLTIPPIAD